MTKQKDQKEAKTASFFCDKAHFELFCLKKICDEMKTAVFVTSWGRLAKRNSKNGKSAAVNRQEESARLETLYGTMNPINHVFISNPDKKPGNPAERGES